MAAAPTKPKKKGAAPVKGVRLGGRQKGTKNKKTSEKQQIIKYREMAARGDVMKLSKEILAEFANYFTRQAAHYAPALPGDTRNPKTNEKKFMTFAGLAIDAAKAAAAYESPKFKTVAYMPMRPPGDTGDTTDDGKPGNVTALDPTEAYRLMKDGGTVTLKVVKKPSAANRG